MTNPALSKTVSSPNVQFSSDEIAAAGGPWKNFTFRVTAQNDTGSSTALEVKLADVITDIRLSNQGTLATSDSADFVTQVTGNEKPSNYAGTTVTFLDYTQSFAITGNGFTKTANPGFGTNLWTREYTVNSGYVGAEFIDKGTAMGLSNNGQAAEALSSLEFALFADTADGKVKVLESGTQVFDTGRGLAGVWGIAYDGVAVRYFCDGILVYSSTKTITAGWTMYAGFNASTIGGSIKNVQFGIMGDQALAQLAINTIGNIVSDNLIAGGSEKRNLLDTYNRIAAEAQRLVAESTSFVSIYGDKTPTERVAASNALTALNTYLNSLTPAWNNIAVNTAVDGPTLSAKFKTLIDANLALQTANNVVLRQHADWDGVTGTGKDALIQQASNADANAQAAIRSIQIIQSDGYLSINEKPDVIREVGIISAEKPVLIAQATALGLPAAAGVSLTFANAYTALIDYLGTLTPAWNNTAADTAIVGPVFSGKFSDYYYARTALANAVAAKAATTSTWSGTANDNGNKPADNATVGAPPGTYVGGQPAEVVGSAIVNFNSRNDRNATTPAAPTMKVPADITHVNNADGTVNLVTAWDWAGDEDSIDGFIIVVRQGAVGEGRTGVTSVVSSSIFGN